MLPLSTMSPQHEHCQHHICIVTETYPPEVNGVALTLARLVHGLLARGHAVSVVRPRRWVSDNPQPDQDTPSGPTATLVHGVPFPGYKGLHIGLPAGSQLQDSWTQNRPDAVYVATQGPLGWIGSRMGVRVTLFAGLALQIVALLMLSGVQTSWAQSLSVVYVMAAQALSGIAKDLTKMSSKSAVKLVVSGDGENELQAALFKWVAVLTGSKNTLKGCGFLLGGVLLSWLGFAVALWAMAAVLAVILLLSVLSLRQDMGKSKEKVKFSQLFSKSREINVLSFARFFLFGSRDVWFVVGLPVFLADALGWSFSSVGAFLAVWVIGYGGVQSVTPQFLRKDGGAAAGAWAARVWGFGLTGLSVGIALLLQAEWQPRLSVIVGLALFGAVFAVNSSLHSYLILAYSNADRVTLDVGFYYMANAAGRLVGTLLSGSMYLLAGLPGCVWTSAGLVLAAAGLTLFLPVKQEDRILTLHFQRSSDC